jgi:hypothetical protein
MTDTTEHGQPWGRLTDRETLQAVPGLARVAVSSGWRLLQWAVTTSVTTNVNMMKAVANGESPIAALQPVIAEWRAVARRGLGLDGADAVATTPQPHRRAGATPDELRDRGAALLRDSADVWYEGDTHPAYARILDELTPDEARILRFLATDGPQPSVDVRTNRPLGVGSELVASGLSMIGLQAGVRHIERTKADLNNLYRLGLIWFSREEVDDPTRYQVVEVQPDVLDAMKQAGRSPKTIHRSIHLTPFGEDFCAVCFPSR